MPRCRLEVGLAFNLTVFSEVRKFYCYLLIDFIIGVSNVIWYRNNRACWIGLVCLFANSRNFGD